MHIELRLPTHHLQIQSHEAIKFFARIESEMQEDPYSDYATYYFLLNFYVNEYLIENTDFDFILTIYHLEKASYKYVFYEFLDIFPEILSALTTGNHFTIDLIEQGWDNYYHFTFNDGFYRIHATNIYDAVVGENEIMTIDDVVIIFHQIKKTWFNLIQNHLNDDFYKIYKKYLRLEG